MSSGFSLIEVVLALGVTSFALLGMVALLPMGLKTSHQAVDAMTEAQIVQYVKNQLELTPFANLKTSWDFATAGTAATLYFDNQGLPTVSTDPQQIYKVTFNVNLGVQLSTSGSGASTVLGANSNLSNSAADADLVQINIVNRTSPGPSATHVYSIVVPNAGF